MSNKAVSRLHADLQKLHAAQKKHHQDAHELHSDEHDLKADRNHLKKARDGYQKDRKELGKDRKVLSHFRDARDEQVAAVEATRQAVQAEYDASVDPLTGQGDPALQLQLQSLADQEATLKATYGQAIDATRGNIDDLKKQIATGKRTITHEQKVITHDHAELKHDKKALAHDKTHIKNARHQALKDLQPAEYKMGLKGTNKARKELGLKAVDHVIRPGPGNVTATMRKLAAAAKSVAMSMGGYVSGGRCATGVSAAIRQAMGLAVYGNGNQIDNNLPRSKFKEVHIPLSEALKIPGLILTWEHTSTALGSIYGHTAITTGDGHSSCSDFIERDTLAGNRSRTGLKIFMPIS